MKSIVFMTQTFIVSVAISCFGQDEPSVSLTEIQSIGGNGEFIRLEEVAADRNGNIYVTDAYRYSVKKFSPSGAPMGEYGKRGNDHEDFGEPPYKIICHNETLAIVAKGTARVQLFTVNFTYAGQFLMPGAIADIIFDRRGRIVAGIIPYDRSENRRLFLMEKSGEIIASAPSCKTADGPAFDMMHISTDSGNKIIVAYRFTNTVVIYTDELKIIKFFTVPGLLPESPSIACENKELGKIPEGDLIKDIGRDPEGNIFVLSGDYTNSPHRDVYLFDPYGSFLTRFQLPQKSGILYIDHQGYLYTREHQRTIIKKYRMAYRNSGAKQP